jgi:hypothetical protein
MEPTRNGVLGEALRFRGKLEPPVQALVAYPENPAVDPLEQDVLAQDPQRLELGLPYVAAIGR